MTLTPEEVDKIAHLARLNLTQEERTVYRTQLSRMIDLIEAMNQIDTTQIEPLAHPLDLSQRLRLDEVSEQNLREKFQDIAPQTEVGLYLVPKVIEEA